MYVFLIRDFNGIGGQEIQTRYVVDSLNAIGVKTVTFSLCPWKGNECDHVISLSQNEFDKYTTISNSVKNKLLFGKLADNYLRKEILAKLNAIGCKVLVNQNYDWVHALPFNKEIKVLQVLHWSIRGYEESLLSTCPYQGMTYWFALLKLKVRGALRLKGLAKCDAIVTLTKSAVIEVGKLLPKYDEQKIHVIPNPLPYSEDANLHSSLQNSNVCFVGRLSVEKGVMRLLRIWELISHELPGYTLSIYGDGPCRSEMEEYIREHSITNVKMCGFERNLQKIYGNADLLVSTSDSEGFGLVFIEAFYFGVPVVSFDCPVSPREVIADAGVLVSCYDEYAYADAVVQVLRDEQGMVDLQEKAVKRARLFYSNAIANNWKNLFCWCKFGCY